MGKLFEIKKDRSMGRSCSMGRNRHSRHPATPATVSVIALSTGQSVASYSFGISYSQPSDTPTSIATAAAALINSTTGTTLISATSSGGIVTLTMKAEYTSQVGFQVSGGMGCDGLFNPCSFAEAVSPQGMITGNYVSTTPAVYDSGTVTAAISNLPVATYTYGSSDTPSTIASGLAAAINSKDSASATATATTVNNVATVQVSSKATGYGINWPIVLSTAYNTNSFSSPSFHGTTTNVAGGYPAVAGVSGGSTVHAVRLLAFGREDRGGAEWGVGERNGAAAGRSERDLQQRRAKVSAAQELAGEFKALDDLGSRSLLEDGLCALRRILQPGENDGPVVHWRGSGHLGWCLRLGILDMGAGGYAIKSAFIPSSPVKFCALTMPYGHDTSAKLQESQVSRLRAVEGKHFEKTTICSRLLICAHRVPKALGDTPVIHLAIFRTGLISIGAC